jgi:hypothetical protein
MHANVVVSPVMHRTERHGVRVFQLAEVELHFGLGTISSDDVSDGPVVVVGDEDPLAEDLVLQCCVCAGVDSEGQAVLGRGVTSQFPGDDALDPGVMTDALDLGGDLVAVASGLAAGQSVCQRGECGGGLGQRLVATTGLGGVQGR